MKTSILQDKIVISIQKLDNWLEKNGWAGFDPYDIKGNNIWMKLTQYGKSSFIQIANDRLLHAMESRFPLFSRKIFHIKGQVNAKAMALFASSYLNLFSIKKEERYFKKATQCLNWLLENSSKGYSGLCWGYPFDWQSRIFIPMGTPSGVVSSTCGNAFWNLYQMTHEKQYLKVCESICQFFLNNLNIDNLDDKRICFSYTPLDNFHVHNENLLVAEFLIRIGSEINNSQFIQMGIKALNYTLKEQNPDGSFYYWGPPDKLLYNIDHYHTGFVLRSLYSIYKNFKSNAFYGEDISDLFSRTKKCYQHYLNNFFENDTIPKLKPDRKYPINIHSCAEAILCLSMLSEDFSEGLEILERTAIWTIENMQDKRGYFYYMMLPKRTIKIPYIRWAQAWMLYALSNLEKLYAATN